MCVLHNFGKILISLIFTIKYTGTHPIAGPSDTNVELALQPKTNVEEACSAQLVLSHAGSKTPSVEFGSYELEIKNNYRSPDLLSIYGDKSEFDHHILFESTSVDLGMRHILCSQLKDNLKLKGSQEFRFHTQPPPKLNCFAVVNCAQTDRPYFCRLRKNTFFLSPFWVQCQ